MATDVRTMNLSDNGDGMVSLNNNTQVQMHGAVFTSVSTNITNRTNEEMSKEKIFNEDVKDRRAAPKMAKKKEFAKFDRPARKPMPIQANLYHRAREFAAPIYDMDEPVEKRTDFRSTVYWNGNVEIDRKGKKVLEFYNSDAVTSFKITAEGFAADGMIGRAEKRFFTQLPFSLSAKLPVEVVTEDVVKIPLTLVNNTNKIIVNFFKT